MPQQMSATPSSYISALRWCRGKSGAGPETKGHWPSEAAREVEEILYSNKYEIHLLRRSLRDLTQRMITTDM